MWELDYKESWVPKNWCFWTVVLETTLESPLDCKEIQPVHSKGDQSWVFIGRTDVEAETPILWPPDANSWLIRKDPDAGKDWEQEEKGMTEDNDWMASPTQWTWVWVDSGSWCWTGRPGVLRFMGLQSQTRLSDWTEWTFMLLFLCSCSSKFPSASLSSSLQILYKVLVFPHQKMSFCCDYCPVCRNLDWLFFFTTLKV